jgi:hypothetical protein
MHIGFGSKVFLKKIVDSRFELIKENPQDDLKK